MALCRPQQEPEAPPDGPAVGSSAIDNLRLPLQGGQIIPSP